MLPDFQFLTAQEIRSLMRRDVASGENALVYTVGATALELIISALVSAGSPVSLVGTVASCATLLTTLVGEAGDEVSLALDIISFCHMVQDDINRKIQWSLDEIEKEKNWKPDSLIFDALNWNKILGKALNYNSTSETQVVKELPDGSFDFRFLLGYKPDGIHQRYLSEELQFLLNCKMEAY